MTILILILFSLSGCATLQPDKFSDDYAARTDRWRVCMENTIAGVFTLVRDGGAGLVDVCERRDWNTPAEGKQGGPIIITGK